MPPARDDLVTNRENKLSRPRPRAGRAVCILSRVREDAVPARSGAQAPPFHITNQQGFVWSLPDFSGRAVVLAFASNADTPLPGGFPRLDLTARIQEIEFRDEPVVVITGDEEMASAYGIRHKPAVVFIDSDGVIRWTSTAPGTETASGLSRRDFIGVACAVSLAAA